MLKSSGPPAATMYWICDLGVRSRIPVGHDETLDAVVEFSHRLHVVGLEQVQHVDGTQPEIGKA